MKWTGKDAGANAAETRFVFWRRAAHEEHRRGTALWLALDELRDRLRGLDLCMNGATQAQIQEMAERVEKRIKENPSFSWDDR